MKRKLLVRLWFAVVFMLLSGCVPIRKGDSMYYVVIGAGIVRVHQTNQVSVVKSTALGLYTGDGRMVLGASSVYSAKVPTNASVVLEITR